MIRFIAFLRRQKETWCMMWVRPPTLIIFGLWDPTIIGSRPDAKKLLLFAATRFQFMQSIRGASSADRFSMLQTNEINLRKNALKKTILLQNSTNQWRAVATKPIFDLRQIKSYLFFWLLSSLDPDRLFGLLLARRNACSSWKYLFFGLRIPCYIRLIRVG